MARARRFWLLKCEPGAYAIEDLERDGVASWEGVRNFTARNFLRDDLKVGDGVLFYASNAEPSGVTGLAEVAREGYPDAFAFAAGHRYFDPKSDPASPTWYMVDIRFVERFPRVVPLEELKSIPALAAMQVVQRGSRLSVQPVSREEYDVVVDRGRTAGAETAAAPAGKPKAKAKPAAKPAPASRPKPKAKAKRVAAKAARRPASAKPARRPAAKPARKTPR